VSRWWGASGQSCVLGELAGPRSRSAHAAHAATSRRTHTHAGWCGRGRTLPCLFMSASPFGFNLVPYIGVAPACAARLVRCRPPRTGSGMHTHRHSLVGADGTHVVVAHRILAFVKQDLVHRDGLAGVVACRGATPNHQPGQARGLCGQLPRPHTLDERAWMPDRLPHQLRRWACKLGSPMQLQWVRGKHLSCSHPCAHSRQIRAPCGGGSPTCVPYTGAHQVWMVVVQASQGSKLPTRDEGRERG